MRWVACLLALSVFMGACGGRVQPAPDEPKGGTVAMMITSPAFQEGGSIPADYTCQGQNSSPALAWSKIPASTKSLALICDDPDAPVGTFVHWVLYNIPADATGLPAGITSQETLENGAVQGVNGARKFGYTGPCPPSGTHRYYFKLHALDKALDLKPGATKDQLLKAMEGHILAQGQLMGRYQKR